MFKYFLLILLCMCLKISGEQDELVFVNILYRHGDRTPIFQYATDPYNNESLWPAKFEQLTNTGKQQHYELGKWFRQRYSALLPELYSHYDIYIESTDVDRTIMSAQSNLAGLYEPVDKDVWNADIKWQPIPVHMYFAKVCPTYNQKFQDFMNTDEMRNYSNIAKPLYDYVSNYSGTVIDTFADVHSLYDTLFIDELYGFKIPDWTTAVYPDILLPWAELSFIVPCYTIELSRLLVGVFLNDMFNRVLDKSQGKLKPDYKMWISSMHDSDVANVLMSFNAFDGHIPPYTASVILELRHSDNIGYYVTVYYKNDSEAHPISIWGCDIKCPLDKVFELLQPVFMTPEQWQTECVNEAYF